MFNGGESGPEKEHGYTQNGIESYTWSNARRKYFVILLSTKYFSIRYSLIFPSIISKHPLYKYTYYVTVHAEFITAKKAPPSNLSTKQ